MKFGGSSLESADALVRMASIVRSTIERKPVVVVSAMGTTTDRLIAISRDAARGDGYHVWKKIKELQEYHLDEAHRVVEEGPMAALETSLRRQFRELHLMLLCIADEGCPLSPQTMDEVLSYGERLSSEVVAAVLQSSGIPTAHVDSRQMIVTDNQHTRAKPLLYETYARVRRVIPILARDRVPVMGGFIGASGSGVVTTMGRGGSDLTATLVGAGLSADEVQVWKDVDGMLTCDPKIMPGGHRLKTVSYAEAAAMARSGAKLLHPETVSPVIRQRIPIVIRNSRRPAGEGTTIVPAAQSGANPIKCISCKQDLTVLEIQSETEQGAKATAAVLEKLCRWYDVPVEFTGIAGGALFLAVPNCSRLESLAYSNDAGLSGLEARVHSGSALISLIGQGIASTPGVMARVLATVADVPVTCIPDPESDLKLGLLVPRKEMKRCVELLHREFFAHVDPELFVACESSTPTAATQTAPALAPKQATVSQPQRLALA